MRPRGFHAENSSKPSPHPGVDAYFDRELTPDAIESLLDSMRHAPSKRKKFDDTQSMLDDLRAPVDTPDFSSVVLGEVGLRRGWLSTGQRRIVFAGRLATAACLLLVVSGLLLVRRNSPETFHAEIPTGPVGEVVEASGIEAGAGLRAISEGLRSFEMRCEPTVAMAANSASARGVVCRKAHRVRASVERDFSLPLSPGLGHWLSASNVKITFVVSRGAHHAADQAPTINHWMIAPQRQDGLPSYESNPAGGQRLINVADWTMPGDQDR